MFNFPRSFSSYTQRLYEGVMILRNWRSSFSSVSPQNVKISSALVSLRARSEPRRWRLGAGFYATSMPFSKLSQLFFTTLRSMATQHNRPVVTTRFLGFTQESPATDIDEILRILEIKPKDSSIASPVTIEKLKQQGFLDLAHKLTTYRSYPWPEIATLSDAGLMEQLADLWELTRNRSAMNFCISIARNKTGELDAKLFLGKVIYLISQGVPVEPHLEQSTADAFLKWVDIAFKEHMSAAINSLKEYRKCHLKTSLQDPDIAMSSRTPIMISQMLLTPNGKINAGIIPLIAETFVADSQHPSSHEQDLLYGLQLLQESAKLRKTFSTYFSRTVSGPAEEVVRTVLNLSPSERVTSVHVRRTALSAFLAHLRQSPNGSCFADATAIQLLALQRKQCLDDWRTLLYTNKLERSHTSFPFINSIGNLETDAILQVDQNGLAHKDGKEFFLWEAPGIQAACDALGLHNHKDAVLSALKGIDGQLSIKKILELLSQLTNKSLTTALFAFEAQTSHPLLKVWRNAIAGMAEAKDGMVNKAILTAVSSALSNLKFKGLTPEQERSLERLDHVILQTMQTRMRLAYDPSIQTSKGSHYQGAFILFDNGSQKDPAKWTRIDDKKAFQEFLLRILKDLSSPAVLSPVKKQSFRNAAIQQLINHVQSDRFILNVLKHYHPENENVSSQSIESLPFTPWSTACGNNACEVLKIYLEHDLQDQVEGVLPQTAEDLLKKFIDFGRQIPEAKKGAFLENPNALLPLRIRDFHAFSLMLGHDSLTDAWKDSSTASQWIEDNVVSPGLEIGNAEIPTDIRQALLDYCSTELIEPSQKESFHIEASEIDTAMTYYELRNAVLTLMKLMDSRSDVSDRYRAQLLDAQLYRLLPETLKDKFAKHAIHFADTNQNLGCQNLHYCCVVNPGTQRLELWKGSANNSSFSPLDQSHLSRVWELYSKPWEIFAG